MTNARRIAAVAVLGAVLLSSADLDARPSRRRDHNAKTASCPTRDPLIAAITEHESHNQAGVIGGRDNQCIGLTQICLHDFPVCKNGNEFIFDAPACLALKQRLLDPGENLRVAQGQLRYWKKWCKRTVGHGGVRNIVFGFAGADGRGVRCGMKQGKHGWVPARTPKVVREILDLYEEKLRGRRRSR